MIVGGFTRTRHCMLIKNKYIGTYKSTNSIGGASCDLSTDIFKQF